MAKKIFPFALVLAFAFIAVFPLLHEGLPPTHDGEYHVVRFHEFDQTLRDGDWYPRWAADLNIGYGAPLFSYVYPLPNYVASFFHVFGFSFIDAFKLNMFVASILGAVFFYLWSKGFWGNWGGMAGAIFYTYSPYHFLDIYIRGSVGEVWALAFFPAFLWCVTKFIKEKRKVFLSLSSLFFALIIFSHNILALIFLPLSVSYALFYILTTKEKKLFDICYLIFAILLGIGLSAVFWLPAILERQYVTGLEIFDASAHFPDLYQLLIPSWGSGFSGENAGDQMSFQIGVANLVVVLTVLFLALFRHSGLSRISHRVWRFWSPHRQLAVRPQNDGNVNVIFFFLVWFFIIFFLMLKVSLPIWQTIPFMNYFQFPWRFLSLEILVASFLAGSVAYFWKSKILALFLIALSFFLGIGYTKPAYYHYRDDSYYLSRSNFIDGTNSPGNAFNTIFFDSSLDKENEKLKFLRGNGDIEQRIINSTYYKFDIEALENSEMQVNTAYFPGWRVFVNNRENEIYKTKRGLFSFNLPKGRNMVEIQFMGTPVRAMGYFFSLISTITLIFFLVKPKIKDKLQQIMLEFGRIKK